MLGFLNFEPQTSNHLYLFLMRVLKILFSVYFFTLTSFPCLCEDMHALNNKQEQISQPSNTHTNGQEEDCSPFCSCSCCPSSVFYSQKIFHLQEPTLFYRSQIFNSPEQSFHSYKSHNIWQPPKLS